MFCQHEAPGVTRQHRACMNIVSGLRRLFRHHVDVLPVLVILTVFHDRQIHFAKLFADGFKVRAVAAVAAVVDFLLRGNEHKAGPQGLVALEAAAGKVARGQDVMVWLGHSSWYLQLAGKRILIDPVFSNYAAPFSFINKAFAGDYPWHAEGMPEIDLLIISHDHYDHLDYATIKALMPKVKRVVTPLGVGSHLRYWGMESAIISEADWNQS